MNYYGDTKTLEYKQCNSVDECGVGNWVLLQDKPKTLCSLGEDMTWQPPLPKQVNMYDFINNEWVKR